MDGWDMLVILSSLALAMVTGFVVGRHWDDKEDSNDKSN
jgi:hypothetical protein